MTTDRPQAPPEDRDEEEPTPKPPGDAGGTGEESPESPAAPPRDTAIPDTEPPPEVDPLAETVVLPAATPHAEPVGSVEVSPASGLYPSSVTVHISSPEETAEVRYTLDGSDPDTSSPLYEPEEDGLLLRASVTLKARAFEEGREPGPVASREYEVRAPVWRENEPTDRADAVPHTDRRGTRSGRWRLAGASIRGKLHAHRALWRDDAFAFGTADGWTKIAVSDGAGSAPLSRVGARLACEAAVTYLEKRLTDLTLHSEDAEGLENSEELRYLRDHLAGAARAALGALREGAAARGKPPADLAATLLVAVHRPWRGRHLVGAVQVGDGTVALLGWDSSVALLGVPDHGEHSSETRFLTTQGVEREFEERVVFSIKDRLRCVAAMTDGVSDDFFPEEKRLVELFLGRNLPGMTGRDGRGVGGVMRAVSGTSAPAPALLDWLRYDKRGSSDDRTLVLFWDES